MFSIPQLNQALKKAGSLSHITLSQLILFFYLSITLKNDILLSQAPTHLPDKVPLVIPPSVSMFLSRTCSMEVNDVAAMWDVLKKEVWHADEDTLLRAIMDEGLREELFRTEGSDLGSDLPYVLWPRVKQCEASRCDNKRKGLKLHTVSQKKAILLSLTGPKPAWSISFTCNTCKTVYHQDYWVTEGTRYYYPDMTAAIQIGDHHYAEVKVLNGWRWSMNNGWMSATNCMRTYLIQHADVSLPKSWNLTLSLLH
ncbi:hypothetical protein PM082_014927 [Marasmius tenuissimus]|nr:hypothetical protein PM082_014927 [Marasmius tenuissimus]